MVPCEGSKCPGSERKSPLLATFPQLFLLPASTGANPPSALCSPLGFPRLRVAALPSLLPFCFFVFFLSIGAFHPLRLFLCLFFCFRRPPTLQAPAAGQTASWEGGGLPHTAGQWRSDRANGLTNEERRGGGDWWVHQSGASFGSKWAG